jgi:hypothetical protein
MTANAPPVFPPLRNRRWGASVCAVLASAASLASVGDAFAVPPIAPRPPQQTVAVVRRGVVWFDEGPVFLKGFTSGSVRLGAINAPDERLSHMTSSATAVAALREEENAGFVGGVPPSPLVPIAQPKLVSGGGCKGWQPGTESVRDFVVAGDNLVAAGECHWDAVSVREPLFVKSLRGGRWRVLRWLAGDSEPVLAAEGNLVAVGVQFSSTSMEVSILDVRNGHTKARLDLPDGYLAFASRDRLVLSVPVRPYDHEILLPGGPSFGDYHLALYSTRGRHLAELGSAQEPPLVSGMHLVTDEEGGQTVSVRSLTGGAPRAVIGFNSPARSLLALAFRWPALVVVETTSTPLLPSEVLCWSGDYGPASKPFLGIFDLARSEPSVPAPALVHVEPSKPLTDCGPAPP